MPLFYLRLRLPPLLERLPDEDPLLLDPLLPEELELPEELPEELLEVLLGE